MSRGRTGTGGAPERRARAARRAVAALGVAAVVAVAGGCSSSSSKATGTVVDVRIRDFAMQPSRTSVPAGSVTFDVANAGPSTHEFHVVRTDLPGNALPLRPDGLSVNDQSAQLHSVGEVDEVKLDGHARLTLDLPPGHYVAYCNLEGHYLGGTYTQFDVSGPRS
ncbi:MAG TPA: cupredoxin domain-containing protein [Acidimicrobiia bacterium]|nr:cupredoxin domain-containing protein [Acidimicrobiia bacterium]